MSYKGHNDYELLYMVNDHNDMVALDILLKKYEKYIYKLVHRFFYYEREKEDYFQEGILVLYKAIKTFDDRYNKTFMRYFEVLITRHFINIYHKHKRESLSMVEFINELIIEESILPDESYELNMVEPTFKSKKEQVVFTYYFKENRSIQRIALETGLNTKQIYNAIYRIRKKLLEEHKL